MPENFLINLIGWVGTILYLIAYALISMKKVEGDSLLSTGLLRLYQGMNIAAGVLLIVNTFTLRAYPSAGLNVAWVGIGLFTLGRKWLPPS
jgi:hypothetical protein